MWIDEIPEKKGWNVLWYDYVLCKNCGAIGAIDLPCPVCSAPTLGFTEEKKNKNGEPFEVKTIYMGAEGRYEDYIYLEMMEREWSRSVQPLETKGFIMRHGMSSRASVVLLFWTYFETRIERLLRLGLTGIPISLVNDLFERYSSIGARLDRLYKIVFDTTYEKDLKSINQEKLWNYLKEVQSRRNKFLHGEPQSIDDSLVYEVVKNIKVEHEAWIKIFNKHVGDRLDKLEK